MPRYLTTEDQSDAEEESHGNQNDDGEVYPADALTEIDPAVEPQDPTHVASSEGPPSTYHQHLPQPVSNPPGPPHSASGPPSTPPHHPPSPLPDTQPSPSTPTLSPTPSPVRSEVANGADPGSLEPVQPVPVPSAGATLMAPDPSPSPFITPLKHQDNPRGTGGASASPEESTSGAAVQAPAGALRSTHSSEGQEPAGEGSQAWSGASGAAATAAAAAAAAAAAQLPPAAPQQGLGPGGAAAPGHAPNWLASDPLLQHHHPCSPAASGPHPSASHPGPAWHSEQPPSTYGSTAAAATTSAARTGAADVVPQPGVAGVGASPLQHPRGGGRAGVASSAGGPGGWRSMLYGSDSANAVGRGTGMDSSGGDWGAGTGGQAAAGLGPVGVRASTGGGTSPLSRHQMASVIQHSIEFGHTAQRIQDLHTHIETLTSRLMTATSERDKAENALIQQARQHQAEEQRLRERLEAQLRQQQEEHQAKAAAYERDIIELKLKVEQLEEQGPKAKLLGRGSEVKLTGEELQGLRQEIAQQETLIQGYQQENVAAMQRIKELEADLKDAAVERMRLALQHDPAGAHQHQQAKCSSKETAARLSEILTMQKELEALRETSTAREQEMKEQIDKLRSEKKQLEAKQGGVDLQQMQAGDALVQAVQAEMEAMRSQYQKVVAELQAKVAWYAENQELLSKNDTLVRGQQDLISQMEHRLAMHEGPLSKTSASRVHALQAQVAALQRAAKARVPPNSLAAVIEAAKPSAEESSMVQELQHQLEAATAKLASKDEEFEMQLRTYQQQYEQLRTAFERERTKMEASAGGRKRERELMAQVEEQRAMYTRKIRDLEAKLKQKVLPTQGSSSSQGGGPPLSRISSGGGDSLSAVGQLRQREAEVAKLKAELERKTKQIAEMHLRLGEAEARVVHLGEGLRSSVPGSPLLASTAWVSTPSKLLQQQQQQPQGQQQQQRQQQDTVRASALYDDRGSGGWQELQQRYIAALEEAASLRKQLAAAKDEIVRLHASPPQERAELQQQLAEARSEAAVAQRRAEATEMALASVQRAHNEAVERSALASAEHQRSLLRIADEAAYKEGLKWQERLAGAETRVRNAQARAEALAVELADVQARVRNGWTPTAAEFLALERRLDEMGREAAAKEAKWQSILEETHSLYSMQADTAQRRWELALEAKNAEIGTFKLKVQELLEAAARIQQQQQQQQQQRALLA